MEYKQSKGIEKASSDTLFTENFDAENSKEHSILAKVSGIYISNATVQK